MFSSLDCLLLGQLDLAELALAEQGHLAGLAIVGHNDHVIARVGRAADRPSTSTGIDGTRAVDLLTGLIRASPAPGRIPGQRE